MGRRREEVSPGRRRKSDNREEEVGQLVSPGSHLQFAWKKVIGKILVFVYPLESVSPALLVRFLREHRSEWADYNLDAYSAASLKTGIRSFPGWRPTKFSGSQTIMPLAHTIENEETLEVVRLEGEGLTHGAILSRNIHLLQTGNVILRVYGTNCPIPPGGNFTYVMQLKDQIGSYFYFPSLAFHKAAGGFGGIRILSRPADDYTLLIGDWFKANHTDLRYMLDSGRDLPFPDGLLINGRGQYGNTFTVEQGKTYRFRISNVGLATSLNVRIQGHTMLLVEVEGSHTLQNSYSSFDLHLGQSCSFLVTADQPPKDYLIAVSSRFISTVLSTTAVFRYSNSGGKSAGPPPGGPTMIDWSLVSSWRDENPKSVAIFLRQ
ncbi:L-ascorbate oxidase homolog [Curcuma longa]|uniref:L-ascorbate oxidase homolog n=1 Tax=Curcuma longa TaxID=136217 RepID=UPI003D9FA5C8